MEKSAVKKVFSSLFPFFEEEEKAMRWPFFLKVFFSLSLSLSFLKERFAQPPSSFPYSSSSSSSSLEAKKTNRTI